MVLPDPVDISHRLRIALPQCESFLSPAHTPRSCVESPLLLQYGIDIMVHPYSEPHLYSPTRSLLLRFPCRFRTCAQRLYCFPQLLGHFGVSRSYDCHKCGAGICAGVCSVRGWLGRVYVFMLGGCVSLFQTHELWSCAWSGGSVHWVEYRYYCFE